MQILQIFKDFDELLELRQQNQSEVQQVVSPISSQTNLILLRFLLWSAGMVLSPNGIAMSEDAMVSLASLDKILAVDREHQTITVQAGVKVSQVRSDFVVLLYFSPPPECTSPETL